jgi:hypothetical protein
VTAPADWPQRGEAAAIDDISIKAECTQYLTETLKLIPNIPIGTKTSE